MPKDLTPKQLRRQEKQLASLMEQEANGAPIPGEIAEKMTKLTEGPMLYQLWVEAKGHIGPLAVGPRMSSKDALEGIVSAINQQIALGKEKVWGNPHILPCVLIN